MDLCNSRRKKLSLHLLDQSKHNQIKSETAANNLGNMRCICRCSFTFNAIVAGQPFDLQYNFCIKVLNLD